ncbi:NADH-cytochrome b5 reductase [Grosmannia clavigera kw1407]|uniref:NADH-cytochrome b5 reductase n=1 Tax=Grosmannia clavigera (strain kw1407 / UAMH 11150) TaxID=655863 RepID=F0X817_GROCL|nr:NADH-cytochrome b5 reductase [Grosmannia clavigera kw1407]EFX05644.1 NADH-cytochrome b5 reductase [Grosmannia clavigera kw1407]
MPSPFFAASRSDLRPLLSQPQHQQPFARFLSGRSSRPRPRIATAASPTMNTSLLLASVVVAAGAYYALHGRGSHSAQAEAPGGTPTFSRFGFHTLKLASSQDINHNVKRLRFDLGDPKKPNGLALTSSLLAITFPAGRWLPVLRPYTPLGHVDLLVKQYPGGKQSTHLHGLQAGDSVTFFRIPAYSYKPNEHSHVGVVAGGQGITPCYQLVRGILLNPEDRTRVTLVWGVNADRDVMLATELAALQRAYPDRLTTHIVASHPSADSQYPKGYVTGELLKSVGIVPDAASEKPSGTATGVSKVFISGPPAMEKTFGGRNGAFTQLGFTKPQVHNF